MTTDSNGLPLINLRAYDGTAAPRNAAEAGDQAIRALELAYVSVPDEVRAAVAKVAQYQHRLKVARGEVSFWKNQVWQWDQNLAAARGRHSQRDIDNLVYAERGLQGARTDEAHNAQKLAVLEPLLASAIASLERYKEAM